MRKFAQLEEGSDRVACVFDWNVEGVSPEYAPQFKQPVEVTGLDPIPGPLWIYDAQTGVFSPPVDP